MEAGGSTTTRATQRTPTYAAATLQKDIAYWRDESMFAATPPLEALRLLLSDLATRRRGGPQGRDAASRRGARKALFIDVRKAHMHAYVEEDVYVAPPP